MDQSSLVPGLVPLNESPALLLMLALCMPIPTRIPVLPTSTSAAFCLSPGLRLPLACG